MKLFVSYQRCVRQAKITEVRNRQFGWRDQGLAVQRFENQVRSSLQHWVCFTPSNESAFTHTVAPTQGAPLIVSTCPEACSDKLVVDEAVFVLARQVMMQTISSQVHNSRASKMEPKVYLPICSSRFLPIRSPILPRALRSRPVRRSQLSLFLVRPEKKSDLFTAVEKTPLYTSLPFGPA